MKFFISFILVTGIATEIFSQPLNGSYTIGGSSPDYATMQIAADVLIANGISGPVIFSIRPGIYTEQGGTAPVMILEAAVSGVSESNTITFKPDESSGGNVNNVILEINGGSPPAGGRTVISVNVDYVTISNLTFRDADTSGNFANSLIRLRGRSGQGIISGIRILNCRLLGSPVFNEIPSPSTGSRGTIYGIWLDKTNLTEFADITFNENYIEKTNYGMFFNAGLSFTDVTIKSNSIKAIHNKVTGSPTNLGAGIHFDRIENASTLNVLNNIINFAGGGGAPLNGIVLKSTSNVTQIQAVIDGNYILNREGKSSSGTFQTNGFSAIGVSTSLSNFNHNIIVSNNMIAENKIRQPGGAIGTRVGIAIRGNNIKIYHNTIVNPFEFINGGSNSFSRALEINGSNTEVINNIIIDYGKNTSGTTNAVAYGIDDTTGLFSDYNVFDVTTGQAVAFVFGTGSSSNFVYSVAALHDKSGTDSNSVQKAVEFIDSVDLHLTDCQMQDPDLAGIPIPGISVDFDGDLRSTTDPTRGVDEAVLNNFRYWSDAFQADLPGFPFSIAADRFSNIVASDIAVPDFDNNQILLYQNSGPSRTFQQSGTLSTPFSPIAVTFYDFDDDGNLDLIAGGQNTDGIRVFWGDGSGGFPQSTDVQTPGSVLNLIPEPFPISPDTQTIFVPFGELFGYLRNYGNREICFEFLYKDPLGNLDTIPDFIHSAIVEDLDGNGFVDVVGIDHTSGTFSLINDIEYVYLAFTQCAITGAFLPGGFTQHQFESGWYSYANSIARGDFDGDSDIDFVTLGLIPGTIIFIKNEGNFNFSHSVIPAEDFAQAIVTLDYDNDGDLDFVTANYSTSNGITLFLNDGSGNFSQARSCFQDLISGFPRGIIADDFDLDGRTDIAVATSFNQFTVLYNENSTTSVKQQTTDISQAEFVLYQNYPNPFNPVTTIAFSIPQTGIVQISVYNILGELVKTLINEERPAGNHSVQFNAKDLSSGIYFCTLYAGSFTHSKKMILLK